jgi:hypothetical protein
MTFLDALSQVLGGPKQQADYSDFVNRYQAGHPAEGYDDREVARRYEQVAPQLPPQDYQEAARAAFERMSPQEREQFAQYVQQQARQQDPGLGGIFSGGPQQYRDPDALARATTQVQQRQPDLLSGLLGQGGMLSSPVAKAALAGIAAMAAQKFLSSRGGMGGGFGGGRSNL